MSFCASFDKIGSAVNWLDAWSSDNLGGVSSHTECLKFTLKLGQLRIKQKNSHGIYESVVVGRMLLVRLLCKVRKFSPITRSRRERCATWIRSCLSLVRSLSLPFQKNGNQTPEFIRGLQFCRWYRSSSADLRQRQNRPSYLFTQISAVPGARFVPLVPRCKSLCSLKLRPLDLFSYCSSRKCIPHTKARSFSLFFAETCHKITFARREHPC